MARLVTDTASPLTELPQLSPTGNRTQSHGDVGRATWRGAAGLAIKAVHTAIFAVVSTSILHIFWAGIRGRPTRWTGAALAIALAECAVFIVNRGRCPLTTLAEEYGAESGRVSDIFLPRWFADRIPQFFTPPLLIGVLALGWRHWRARHTPPLGVRDGAGYEQRSLKLPPIYLSAGFRPPPIDKNTSW